MSACRFIASDKPLPEFAPSQNYPFHINVDDGTLHDGGADDNFFLKAFSDVGDYTDKKYGVYLEWDYTDGRARRIIEYIKTALQKTDSAELWHVWQTEYYEFEDRPFIHRKTVSVAELTAEHIKELDEAEIFNIPDRMYPDRPSFYCLKIVGKE